MGELICALQILMKLIFCGTPGFAVPCLEALVEAGFEILLVITQPDRPQGRKMEVVFSPIKQAAQRLGLQIVQPEKIKNNEDFRDQLTALKPDAIIVVGYGKIIPRWMIDLPLFGNINLHASLLPKYRGAAPIQWAIANGENTTGVTIMRIDAGLDTGDILLQKELAINPEDTALTLGPKLAKLGSALMVDTLQRLQNGALQAIPQNNNEATLAPILKKEDGEIDFHRTAVEICNRLRGFQPWPGAFTKFRGKNLNLWQALPVQQAVAPSEFFLQNNCLLVGCGACTSLEIFELQIEGKRRMLARDFIQGYRPTTGEALGK
jgi:methionyl-tRNA formyltransferase